MASSMTIRRATANDAAELARLNALFNGSSDAPEILSSRLSDMDCPETALLGEWRGRVAGFAAVRLTRGLFYVEPHAELTELYVEDGARREGLGRALVEAVARLAWQAGAAELWVLTGVDNQPAHSLYLSCGFQPAEVALSKALGSPESRSLR